MTVDTKHPEYMNMEDEWKLVAACSSGQREVKKLKRAILPAPGETDGNFDRFRYDAYLKRAIYTNITGRTRAGLTGAAFRRSPEVDLPTELEYLDDNADGSGQSITQLAKDVTASLFESGREILLVDHPAVEEGLTAEQVAAIDAKAYIRRYGALQLINWRTESFGGREQLTLVVLQEPFNESEDEFTHAANVQHRVLRLRDGVYTQQLYRDGKPVTVEAAPTQSDGKFFDFIPVFIIGSQNNDASVDEIPLADIAHVNVGHYRNSADLEENSFIHSQLTLGVTTDLSADEFEKANPGGIQVGARKGHYLGTAGDFHSVQAEANNLADNLMERKEKQMVALGAKLVEARGAAETATQVKVEAVGENSVLNDMIDNVEEGLQVSIEWVGLFMGTEVDGDDAFKMNREFFDSSVDPQLLIASIQLGDRGILAQQDLINLSRRAGLIEEDRTDEEIIGEAEAADPLLGAPREQQSIPDRRSESS